MKDPNNRIALDTNSMTNENEITNDYKLLLRCGNSLFVREVSDTTNASEAPVVLLVVHGGPGIADHTESFHGLKNILHKSQWGANDNAHGGGHNRVGVVVFYDQLGCGKSDKPTNVDGGHYSLNSYVNELRQVVQFLSNKHKHSPVCVLGHSWGGQILLELLLSFNGDHDTIRSLITCAIVSNTALDMKIHEQKQQQMREALDEETRQFYEQDEEQFSAECSIGFLIYQKLIGKSETHITGEMKGWEVISRIDNLKHPCLFISGRMDSIPFEEYCKIEGIIDIDKKNHLGEVLILEEGDHRPWSTSNDYFFAVNNFISVHCGDVDGKAQHTNFNISQTCKTCPNPTFDEILDIVGIDFYKYLTPKDLFSVGICSHQRFDEVCKNIIQIFMQHLPLELGEGTKSLISFSKRHSFSSKEQMIDYFADRIKASGIRLANDTENAEGASNRVKTALNDDSGFVMVEGTNENELIPATCIYRSEIPFDSTLMFIQYILNNDKHKDTPAHRFVRNWVLCIVYLKRNDAFVAGQWRWYLPHPNFLHSGGFEGLGVMMSFLETGETIELSWKRFSIT